MRRVSEAFQKAGLATCASEQGTAIAVHSLDTVCLLLPHIQRFCTRLSYGCSCTNVWSAVTYEEHVHAVFICLVAHVLERFREGLLDQKPFTRAVECLKYIHGREHLVRIECGCAGVAGEDGALELVEVDVTT